MARGVPIYASRVTGATLYTPVLPVLLRYCMFKFSSFAPSPSDWSFDVYHNSSVLSYWLSAYYQCFLLLMGNAQVRPEAVLRL